MVKYGGRTGGRTARSAGPVLVRDSPGSGAAGAGGGPWGR